MNRYAIAGILGVAYMMFRLGIVVAPPPRPAPPRPAPAPAPTPAPPAPTPAAPFPEVAKVAGGMNAEDRGVLADTYLILSRSVAANPTLEPVFPDTAAVRRAHRAALLYVWAAVLKNRVGEVPGLRDALEQAVAARIGKEDVPLNPDLQQQAAKAFSDIAASFR